jgi:prepilin-type N-terminal cleavage/methylation domain-containing protein
MLRKIKKINSEGFTIIEVMIVLGIAAMILLIVLLAVPALQRSANNTSRKEDANAIATSLSNWINNNNGTLPSGVANNGNTNVLVIGATGTGATTNTEQANLGFYKAGTASSTTQSSTNVGNIWISNVTATETVNAVPLTTASSATNVNQNSISIITGITCNGGTASTNETVSANGATVWYATDSGSSTPNLQCIDVT